MSNEATETKTLKEVVLGGIFFYFLLHTISTLVESIYLLDLLNTQLDEKVLGLLFFFTTPLLLFTAKEPHSTILKITGIGFISFRVLYPFVTTAGKILVAGMGLGMALLFYPLYLHIRAKARDNFAIIFSNSIGIGILLSILFRSLNSSWDLTEVGIFRFIPLLLGISAGYMLLTLPPDIQQSKLAEQNQATTISIVQIMGIFSMIILVYFIYSSPGIISRWAEFPYIWAVILPSLAIGGFMVVQIRMMDVLGYFHGYRLLLLNTLFFTSLLLIIVVNQTPFLAIGDTSPVLVDSTPWYSYLFLIINLVLSPTILVNIAALLGSKEENKTSLKGIITGFFISEWIFVILIFMLIFTNVWGYVEPVSQLFRGLFWLPFLILSLMSITSIYITGSKSLTQTTTIPTTEQVMSILIIGLLSISPIIAASLGSTTVPEEDLNSSQLRILTYNIQQGANIYGDKNYEEQLGLIKDINPDIIGLQESDIAKINTANTDIVRYFAENLGFYSYYGPKTVMQTYGVALLSRYPIINPLTFYTTGDEDEIGSIQAQVEINSEVYTIFVNHPAGSDDSKLDHTTTMLDLADESDQVVLLGDFNWRSDTMFYTMVTENYVDTWRALWPTGVNDQDLNMSRAIDHIFVSPSFSVVNAMYIPTPQSQTDHPAYWVDLEY